MIRRLLIVAVIVAATLIPAAPAAAHTGYCGHGVARHYYPWPHTVTWLRSLRTSDGAHWHLVRADGRLESGTPTWVKCPTTVLTGF